MWLMCHSYLRDKESKSQRGSTFGPRSHNEQGSKTESSQSFWSSHTASVPDQCVIDSRCPCDVLEDGIKDRRKDWNAEVYSIKFTQG